MYLLEYYKKDCYGFDKFQSKAVALKHYKTLKRLDYEVKPPQLIDKSVVDALYWYAVEYERPTIEIYNVLFKTSDTTIYKNCLITSAGTDYSIYVLDKRGPGLMVRAAGFDSCQHNLNHNELIELCAAWINHNYIKEAKK
tara:strand:+ start:73 stop:492 length:420 start_codon:yes stop_codon:yes gene_type:complete